MIIYVTIATTIFLATGGNEVHTVDLEFFCENFIFANSIKRHISDVKKIAIKQDLPTVYSPYLEFQGTGQNMSSYQ